MQRLLHQPFSLYLVVASGAIHLLCCGLPILLSAGSAAAMIGFSAGHQWLQIEWLHALEIPLLIVSGTILLLTGAVQFFAERINCRTDSNCQHMPCDRKKALAQRIYLVAAGLFAVNLVIFALTH